MLDARKWERRYLRKLFITDFAVIVVAVFGAQLIRFGVVAADLHIGALQRNNFALTYSVVSVVLVLAWMSALSIGDTRDSRIIGSGASEYKRVVNSTVFIFGVYAIVAFLSKAQIGRGYLLIALPAGLSLLLISRWLWRKRLHRQRKRALNQYRTLVVGERMKCRHVVEQISRNTYAGFHVVGAVTDSFGASEIMPGVPVVSDYQRVIEAVDEHAVDTVIMTSTDAISPERLREIGWEFESRRVDLVVAAALTDVAGPRIHMRPVSGLPLIHVDYPKFVGRRQFAKRMFDLAGSSLLILLLSPLLIAIGLLVKFSSPGPVFFKQKRIGLGGAPFRMFNFRSMVVDAEEQLPGLLDRSESNGILFKMKNDPRVTRVGRTLRRYSLDELPQLLNVFGGSMSLVGPRPPLPSEVETYETWVHRRLLVKPGITGLWQVSGRSDLSWEDSVRLDLYYVENWSLVGDILLLMRTVKTVVKPDGAY